MTPDRKRQILTAEALFASRERLSRALAEKGFYIVGRLTNETPDLDIRKSSDLCGVK